MCGLSALLAFRGRLTRSDLQIMTDVIKHRGPDGEGFRVFPDSEDGTYRVGLGHRRLAIIDPGPSGAQPLGCSQGRFWIIFNGEIYNYLELQESLKSEGVVCRSRGDTEVLLQAYLHWGSSCLQRLNGMFAFVIYDRQTQEIFAARDRFGVKPLYFWRSPEGFLAIASEIKQFVHLPGWRAQLSGELAYDFLQWGITAHRRETLFKGVHQLRGGESLSAKLDELPNFKLEKWYRPKLEEDLGSYEESAQKLEFLLEDAVRLRLRSDVPVGSCLSGGLDSSSIVCLMRRLLGDGMASQNTFSACVNHGPLDESPYMREVVAKTGVRAHYTYPDLNQLWEELDRIVWHQDEPFGSTSIFAQWEVFRLAQKQQVKVLLDGQGADEILGGYQTFWGPFLKEVWLREGWRSVRREMKACSQRQALLNPWRLLVGGLLSERVKGWLRPAMRGSPVNLQKLGIEARNPFQSDQPPLGPVNRLCYSLVTSTNLPMLLHYEDRDSMAHSVESRTPFVDYRVVEFVLGLSYRYKMGDGWSKKVLREAMKEVLPDKIRHRSDKLGFVTPEELWVTREQPQRFKEEIRRAVESSKGVLGEAAIDLADAIIDRRRPFDFQVWRLLVFGRWMETFNCEVA